MEVTTFTPGAAFRRAQTYAQKAVDRMRSTSTTTVNCPPSDGVGIGNLLYFLLWGHAGRRSGLEWSVLRTPSLEPWLQTFPQLEELAVKPETVRFLDRRVQDWSQDFAKFSPHALETFVVERLLSSETFQDLLQPADLDVVTVNVRRGDYYSVPSFRARYGFDVATYVDAAMRRSSEQGEIKRVQVISDDIEWCQKNISFVENYGLVDYQPAGLSALRSLAVLASSRRLVLANSTFSYWGAFLSNGVFKSNHEYIWAPNFHERGIAASKPYQIDPRWGTVDRIDGGWREHP